MKSALAPLTALLALAVGGPVAAQPPAVLDGFVGRSTGDGILRMFGGRSRPFHVESSGAERPDGRRQLDQTVFMSGQPPRNRSWVMTPAGPHQFVGTLSDAAGPVVARADGSRLVLRYRVAGPFVMHQTLDRLPDGRTTANAGRITVLGVPVGRLRETIVHTD